MKRIEGIVAKSCSDVVGALQMKMHYYYKRYYTLCVLSVIEAAAIIEAQWHHYLNELWTVFVPHDEMVRRVMERDQLPREQVIFLWSSASLDGKLVVTE